MRISLFLFLKLTVVCVSFSPEIVLHFDDLGDGDVAFVVVLPPPFR